MSLKLLTMPKFLSAIVCFLFFYTNLSAQDKLLVAEGTSPNLYITHVITPKENYYSVGRMYNVSPRELAPYNNLTFEKGFSLGQTIKIPLGPNNFLQGGGGNENEVLVPVYHIMQPKEGLYRVSMTYNKVPLDALKKWNKLSGDAVSTGTKLIVGYLKVLKDQSPLASQAINNSSSVVTKPAEQKKIKIPEPKEVITTTEDTKKVKEVTQPVNTPKDNSVEIKTSGTINFNGGKFKGLYNDQAKNKSTVIESGSAATFKTTSGWQDGKYYCFHNTATPGTIIKVTNNTNGKSVYAKVLDAIPDIKQNSGLLLRLSNSAAEELGAVESKFDCQISYAK